MAEQAPSWAEHWATHARQLPSPEPKPAADEDAPPAQDAYQRSRTQSYLTGRLEPEEGGQWSLGEGERRCGARRVRARQAEHCVDAHRSHKAELANYIRGHAGTVSEALAVPTRRFLDPWESHNDTAYSTHEPTHWAHTSSDDTHTGAANCPCKPCRSRRTRRHSICDLMTHTSDLLHTIWTPNNTHKTHTASHSQAYTAGYNQYAAGLDAGAKTSTRADRVTPYAGHQCGSLYGYEHAYTKRRGSLPGYTSSSTRTHSSSSALDLAALYAKYPALLLGSGHNAPRGTLAPEPAPRAAGLARSPLVSPRAPWSPPSLDTKATTNTYSTYSNTAMLGHHHNSSRDPQAGWESEYRAAVRAAGLRASTEDGLSGVGVGSVRRVCEMGPTQDERVLRDLARKVAGLRLRRDMQPIVNEERRQSREDLTETRALRAFYSGKLNKQIHSPAATHTVQVDRALRLVDSARRHAHAAKMAQRPQTSPAATARILARLGAPMSETALYSGEDSYGSEGCGVSMMKAEALKRRVAQYTRERAEQTRTSHSTAAQALKLQAQRVRQAIRAEKRTASARAESINRRLDRHMARFGPTTSSDGSSSC